MQEYQKQMSSRPKATEAIQVRHFEVQRIEDVGMMKRRVKTQTLTHAQLLQQQRAQQPQQRRAQQQRKMQKQQRQRARLLQKSQTMAKQQVKCTPVNCCPLHTNGWIQALMDEISPTKPTEKHTYGESPMLRELYPDSTALGPN